MGRCLVMSIGGGPILEYHIGKFLDKDFFTLQQMFGSEPSKAKKEFCAKLLGD